MYLDNQAVCPGSDSGNRHRAHHAAASRAVARIHHDRQMRKLLDGGYSTQVKGIPGVSLVSADAPLAEDYIITALAHDVLSRIEPLLDGSAEAALQHDRLACPAHFLQQLEVLHVPGANLQHICIACHSLDRTLVHNLGDNLQAVSIRCLPEHFQPLFCQPLKIVWGGTRLESTAPQELGTSLGHGSS